jgi:hypothetical protein
VESEGDFRGRPPENTTVSPRLQHRGLPGQAMTNPLVSNSLDRSRSVQATIFPPIVNVFSFFFSKNLSKFLMQKVYKHEFHLPATQRI